MAILVTTLEIGTPANGVGGQFIFTAPKDGTYTFSIVPEGVSASGEMGIIGLLDGVIATTVSGLKLAFQGEGIDPVLIDATEGTVLDLVIEMATGQVFDLSVGSARLIAVVTLDAVVTNRTDKGAELTYAEMDANFVVGANAAAAIEKIKKETLLAHPALHVDLFAEGLPLGAEYFLGYTAAGEFGWVYISGTTIYMERAIPEFDDDGLSAVPILGGVLVSFLSEGGVTVGVRVASADSYGNLEWNAAISPMPSKLQEIVLTRFPRPSAASGFMAVMSNGYDSNSFKGVLYIHQECVSFTTSGINTLLYQEGEPIANDLVLASISVSLAGVAYRCKRWCTFSTDAYGTNVFQEYELLV